MSRIHHFGLVLALLLQCDATPIAAIDSQVDRPDSRQLQSLCLSDNDCDMGLYCNRGLCRVGGYCENTIDCQNPSNFYSVNECVGFLYCSSTNECLVECAGSMCENSNRFDCTDSPPCEISECSDDYVSCVNDDCGGCNAHYFSASGEVVCTFQDNSDEFGCLSDADCGTGGMYCLNGECANFGTCDDTIDCQNPANTYSDIDCVGYTSCVSNACTKTCSEDSCPSEDIVQCYAPPCEVTLCSEEVVSCTDRTCGECKALFFDAAGKQVCENEMPNGGCGVVDTCEQTDAWELSLCQAKVFIRTLTCSLRY